ncbi:MAG: secretin N-terminal domain-containing protein [Burkholderiaceae bacterium]
MSQSPVKSPVLHTLAIAVLLLGGCAAQREHRDGLDYAAQGKSEQALTSLRRANELEPDNVRYKLDFVMQRNVAVRNLVEHGDDARKLLQFDAASQHYREALKIEPGNERAARGMKMVDVERRAQVQLAAAERALKANQLESARNTVHAVLLEMPQNTAATDLARSIEDKVDADRRAREEQTAARSAFKRPVTLQFRDAPLRMVFEALSKAANVNLILDRDVRSDARTTIFVKDASVEDSIELILLQNQLEKRVLNSNTLLIYPVGAAKQKEYAELKVRTFQLSNIDATFMSNIVKTMVKTKDIVIDAKTNTMVMRDTADAVALAERLVAANDLPDPEVMLEVEVLEVSSSRASALGLQLPSSITVSTPSTALTVGDFRSLGRNDLRVTGLAATLNLMLQDGSANILASPRIRTRNKEKAKILVGDKLPVITNLLSPQASGQSTVLTGSISYVDVGIKLEVEPQVYADGDVGIKVNLDVSNVTGELKTDSGQAYKIGTRSAQTVLRLHDGETQVLAGLISDSDRNSASRVPGLGQLPVVGKLFSSESGDKQKTEIILSITPRIIRPMASPDPRNADAWSGSEAMVRDRQYLTDPIGVVQAEQAGPGTSAPAQGASPAGRRPIVRPLPRPGGDAVPVPAVPVEPAAPAAAPATPAAPTGADPATPASPAPAKS